MNAVTLEFLLLLSACACYLLAGGGTAAAHYGARKAILLSGSLLAAGLVLHTASLGVRWEAMGHGPFTTLYEILTSNVWSLMLVISVAYLWLPAVRSALLLALPVVAVLMLWMFAVDPGPGHFPATYGTPLLYVHVTLGKIFLGLLLVAVGTAGLVWLRATRWGALRLAGLPNDTALEELAYRFAAFALVFDSAMLIAGAVWAQDAWGRYWAWDPLETWAFLTWLALVAALHARVTWRLRPATMALLLGGVFVVAFLTFFGVPFISMSPHKGAI